MKKIHIALAVIVTVTLFSCVQEKSFEQTPVGENTIAFVLQTGTSTRADFNPTTKGITVPVGQTEDGRTIYLEETITDLSQVAPETRGTPIYTENVGKLYSSNLDVHASVASFNAVYECMDKSLTYDHDKNDHDKGLGWRYQHQYAGDPWNGITSPVDFYLSIPDNMTSYGVTWDTNAPYADGKFKFSYTSKTTAAEQQDLIFGVAPQLTKEIHKAALPNGYPVLFQHALTAVKFAINNPATERASKGIVVTGISFTGLKNTGTCEVSPNATGTNKKVDWKTASANPTTNVISQTFTDAENDITYTDGLFPESFGVNNNTGAELNKADASYTFWLIPQTIPNDSPVVLTISYTINGASETKEIHLKDLFTQGVTWEAGQLRTYTFKLDDVNVKIDDTVTIKGEASNAYSTSVKNGVTITNTGNTDAFIRAALVGQWWNKKQGSDQNKPEIVFGFTDAVGRLDVVESWYEDQFVSTTTPAKHGTFVGLPGYKGADAFKPDSQGSTDGWVLCIDNYYYYTKPVPANQTTSALFDSYTLGTPPTPTYGGRVWSSNDIYFTLEVATQAISANNLDGSHKVWDAAWEDATTVKPVQKTNN